MRRFASELLTALVMSALALANLSVLVSLHLLLGRALPRALLAFLSIGFSGLFALTNAIKIQQTQAPVLPSDLLLFEHANLLLERLPPEQGGVPLAGAVPVVDTYDKYPKTRPHGPW